MNFNSKHILLEGKKSINGLEVSHMLYENKEEIGGFASNFYWSSTEDDNLNAWYQNLFNGNQLNFNMNYFNYVRAVRAS
jgi:hypothetical protein